MKRLIIILFLVAMMSCRTGREVTHTDSTRVVTVLVPHDSVVYLPADSSVVALLVACDSMNNAVLEEISRLNGERVQQQVILRHDTLFVRARIDSQAVAIAWNDKHVTTEHKKERVIVQTLTVKVKPAWMQALAWAGGVSLACWGLVLIVKLFK